MINTREIAEEYRLSHWAGVMKEQSASGLNKSAYCESAGIHKNVYYYWQRKLRETAYFALIEQEPENTTVPNGWTKVMPGSVSSAEKSLTIEVGGCRITATAETDPELLAKICRTLKTI